MGITIHETEAQNPSAIHPRLVLGVVRLTPGQLLRHEEQKLAVLVVNLAQQAS